MKGKRKRKIPPRNSLNWDWTIKRASDIIINFFPHLFLCEIPSRQPPLVKRRPGKKRFEWAQVVFGSRASTKILSAKRNVWVFSVSWWVAGEPSESAMTLNVIRLNTCTLCRLSLISENLILTRDTRLVEWTIMLMVQFRWSVGFVPMFTLSWGEKPVELAACG